MDENRVNDIIANAAMLMNDERFNAILEAKSMSTHRRAKANGGKLDTGGSGGFSSDLALFEAQAGFGGGSRQSSGQNLIPKVQSQPKKSNLPPEIQESFKKMPPLSGGEITVPASYGQSRSVIQEQQYAPQQPQYQPQAQANIDYNYIKYLVNECIKENMNQLNESASLSGIKLVGGGKIQFTDSKGNVFEGVLKRVK